MAGLEGGIASPPLKEVGEGLRQVAQALLEGHAGDVIEKGLLTLLFEHRQSSGELTGREAAFLRFDSVLAIPISPYCMLLWPFRVWPLYCSQSERHLATGFPPPLEGTEIMRSVESDE